MGNKDSKQERVETVDYVQPGAKEAAIEEADKEFAAKYVWDGLVEGESRKKERRDNLSKALSKYKVGDKLSLRKKFDLKGLESINIALFGPSGAGKSSLIGLAQVLFDNGKITVETQDSGCEGTTNLETFFDDKDFRVYDTRGFQALDGETIEELKKIINGDIAKGNVIPRANEELAHAEENLPIPDKSAAPLEDRIHAVIMLVDIQDPRKDYYAANKMLGELKIHCKKNGMETVCVFVCNEIGDFSDVLDNDTISRTLGTASDRVFKITNHIALKTPEEKIKLDYNSQLEVLEVVDTAILAGERYIKFFKQRELNARKKQGSQNLSDKTVEELFADVAAEHGLPKSKLQGFLNYLEKECVTTAKDLLANWDELDPKQLPSANIQRWIKDKAL